MSPATPSPATPSPATPSPATMSLATSFPAAVLETILIRLAALFLTGAGGDIAGARHAASQMLVAYHPETEDELSLAASIIAFSFQALEALAQAAAPDIPLTRILRLRSGAVSLSRESAKAERRLIQLQKTRKQAIPAEIQPEPVQLEAKSEKPVATFAKANGLTWTQAHEQRQRDLRIAASLKRAEDRIAAQASTAIQAAPPAQRPATANSQA
jgi:hypothetical protein